MVDDVRRAGLGTGPGESIWMAADGRAAAGFRF
jgi:hypothetical protein